MCEASSPRHLHAFKVWCLGAGEGLLLCLFNDVPLYTFHYGAIEETSGYESGPENQQC